jgi:O-antigen chain-terminating methyltransferase
MHIPDPREREVARRYFLPFLRIFRPCRAVLDLASGQGHFLELLREHEIPASGVELDAELCRLSQAKGLQVTRADLFEFLGAVAPGAFDGANASHIVEHFAPPQVEQILSLAHRALAPDAPLLILTPNIANLRRAVGDFWRDPTHVRPYPIPALHKLLRRTGWEILESGEHSDRSPSPVRRLVYALRNAALGRYWCGDDVYVIARRPS